MADFHLKPVPRIGLALLGAASITLSAAADTAPRGAELLQPFKQQMMGALKAGLAEGPSAAIEACSVQAPAIAAGLSVDGVELGRTSHRLRNPVNAGPDWATQVLQDYLDSGDRSPRTVTLPDGRKGYVEPIATQALCLTCHGEELAPEVAGTIREQYPQDRAVGFAEGDLRGVFWVSWPDP